MGSPCWDDASCLQGMRDRTGSHPPTHSHCSLPQLANGHAPHRCPLLPLVPPHHRHPLPPCFPRTLPSFPPCSTCQPVPPRTHPSALSLCPPIPSPPPAPNAAQATLCNVELCPDQPASSGQLKVFLGILGQGEELLRALVEDDAQVAENDWPIELAHGGKGGEGEQQRGTEGHRGAQRGTEGHRGHRGRACLVSPI
ncbi:unnamed protein product [Closterium sp. NIES-54]